MIAELLEKFEDLFQPYSPEEAGKRIPKGAVVLILDIYYVRDDGIYTIHRRLRGVPATIVVSKGSIMIPSDKEDNHRLYGEYMTLDGDHYVDLEDDWFKPYHTPED